MTKHDMFDPDWDADALMVIVGEHLVRQEPALLEEDERFMNWLVRDLRRRPGAGVDWSAERVRRLSRRARDRALAERHALASVSGAPHVRQVLSRPVREMLDEAARTRCAPWTKLAAAAGLGRDLWDEECDQWIELPDGVAGGRFVALQVAGDSMTPLLHSGDTILVRLGDAVERDTIVVARHADDGYVVKQVGRRSRYAIELLPLNKAYEPLMLRLAPGAVLGTVIMRWCTHDESVRIVTTG